MAHRPPATTSAARQAASCGRVGGEATAIRYVHRTTIPPPAPALPQTRASPQATATTSDRTMVGPWCPYTAAPSAAAIADATVTRPIVAARVWYGPPRSFMATLKPARLAQVALAAPR